MQSKCKKENWTKKRTILLSNSCQKSTARSFAAFWSPFIIVLFFFVYLHGGAVALVCVGKPAVSCCALVQVDVLNVDVHTDHTSDTDKHKGRGRFCGNASVSVQRKSNRGCACHQPLLQALSPSIMLHHHSSASSDLTRHVLSDCVNKYSLWGAGGGKK